MKVHIDSALTLERWRDALDLVVEKPFVGVDALDGIDWTGGTLEMIGGGGMRLVSADKQHVARFDVQSYWWQILHACDECGREEWSEHKEWSCNCRPEPTSADPEGWRE